MQADTSGTIIGNTPPQVKPNRHRRRAIQAMARQDSKAAKIDSFYRRKYFQKLQNWLGGQPESESTDAVFKLTLTKLFKRGFKQDHEFAAALESSKRHVKQQAMLAAKKAAPQTST